MHAEPCPTILLFAQDETLRRAIVRTLEREGARVVELETGAQAHDLCDPSVVPELAVVVRAWDQREANQLASVLQQRYPRLPLLYTGTATGEPDEPGEFLEMPFSPAQLVHRTRALIGALERHPRDRCT
jgi:DNA-binding response OmpR family regulator